MPTLRVGSDGIWLAFANFCRYIAFVFVLLAILMLGQGVVSNPDFPLIPAVLSTLYGSMVFSPLFVVSGALFAIAIQVSRSALAWIVTALVTYPIAPFLLTVWLAPGCRYSKMWEPLCSLEIRNAVTLSGSESWIFVATHLIASICLIWGHRSRIRRLQVAQREATQ